MKKLICMLLAIMLCTSLACAETVAVGGVSLNVPEGWQAASSPERTILYPYSDVPAKNIFVTSKPLNEWDNLTATKNGLQNYLQLMGKGFFMLEDTQEDEAANECFVPLKQGGLAWKAAFKNEAGATVGYLIIAADRKLTIVSMRDSDGDVEKCLNILSNMLLPMQVTEVFKVADLHLAVPAGWSVSDDEREETGWTFTDDSGSMIAVSTLVSTPEAMQQVIDAGEEQVLLIQLTHMLINGFTQSNLQAQELDLNNHPALVCSMNATVDGSTGSVGTLAARSGHTAVQALIVCAGANIQYVQNTMDVLLYPMQQNHYVLSSSNLELAYPEGYTLVNAESTENGGSALFSDQQHAALLAYQSTLSDEDKAKAPHKLLADIAMETLGEEYSAKMDFRFEAYDSVLSLRSTGFCKAVDSIPTAISYAWLLSGDQLIRLTAFRPNGTASETDAMITSVLPAASTEDLTMGNATFHVPSGWLRSEDGNLIIWRNPDKYLTLKYEPVSEELHETIANLGEQTALEIYLSILAEEGGAHGVTIEYTIENGVHIARTRGTLQDCGFALAYLLDGNTLMIVTVEFFNDTEASAYELLNQFLGTR